mgnify:CR=1 FL=1
MAKNKKRTQLSSEGKTELAKAIAEKSQNFAKTYANVENQIGKFFRWLSGWLDKLLFNQKHGKLVASRVSHSMRVRFCQGPTVILPFTKGTVMKGDSSAALMWEDPLSSCQVS